jgi:putative CocE/NonD family hydrolase
MFATGINEFRKLEAWPPAGVRPLVLSLQAAGQLVEHAPPVAARTFDEYVSDPNRPVPYVGYVAPGMTADYMTEDQRFAATRPDVLVYSTGVLDDDLTVAGPISVSLTVSSTGTDSDFIVKVIDAYPENYPQPDPVAAVPGQPAPRPATNYVRMGGYQQLVRGEPFRAKFRRGFETPVPLVPGEPAEIRFDLPDVYHVFRPGHRIIVQVQSSWFPLVDRNPQRFMEIPKAGASDFQRATERIYHGSTLTLPIESGSLRVRAAR